MVRSRGKGESKRVGLNGKSQKNGSLNDEGDENESSTFTRILGFIALCSVIFLFGTYLSRLTKSVDDGETVIRDFEKFLKEQVDNKRKGRGGGNAGDDDTEEDDGVPLSEQKYQGEKTLPWENPFLSKTMKNGGGTVYVDIDKTEDEVLAEALQDQIFEWQRDFSQKSEEIEEIKEALEATESNYDSLRQKQTFVENKIRDMLAIKNLRSYDYQDHKVLLQLPKAFADMKELTPAASQSSSGSSNVGISLSGAKYAILTSSAKSSNAKKNGNRVIEETLKSLEYAPQTEKGQGLPLFLISYGSLCHKRNAIIKTDANPHIFFCVYHHSMPVSRTYPYSTLVDGNKVASELENANPKLKNIPGIIRNTWKAKHVQKIYKLFDTSENEEVIQRSKTSSNSVWVVVPNHGQGTPQLTLQIEKIASMYSKPSLGCIAFEYNNAPVLWNNKKVLFRSWIVLARSNPLLAYYGGTHTVRSTKAFKPFDASQTKGMTKEEKVAMHFPNTSPDFELSSLAALAQGFQGMQVKALEKKLAALATYAVTALHIQNRMAESEIDASPKHVRIEHLCMDFSIADMNNLDTIKLESVSTECSLTKGATPVISNKITKLAVKAGENLLTGSTESLKGFPVVVDESKDSIFR